MSGFGDDGGQKQYDDRNTGMLFDNDDSPDVRSGKKAKLSGKWIDEMGQEHFLDAYLRQGKRGPFLSLRAKLKSKQPLDQPGGGRSGGGGGSGRGGWDDRAPSTPEK